MKVVAMYTVVITILIKVVGDLGRFLSLFIVVVALFSLIFSALGIGNDPQDPEIGYEEYANSVGLLVGNVLNTLRQAIGEFGMFEAAIDNPSQEVNVMFWFFWFAIVLTLNIIFLNFIIAEAGASYNEIKECIDENVRREKCYLIAEAEDMVPLLFKKRSEYPKYIISRSVVV